jgi:hypothetical protein
MFQEFGRGEKEDIYLNTNPTKDSRTVMNLAIEIMRILLTVFQAAGGLQSSSALWLSFLLV